MLFELVIFGGTVFWVIFGLYIMALFSFGEEEGGYRAALLLLGGAIFYAISRPPIISWEWIVSYFVVGLVWWFLIFNVRLAKLRRYLKGNPEFIVGEKLLTQVYKEVTKINSASGLEYKDSVLIKTMPNEFVSIYNYEPSPTTFFDRTLCWPISMVKFACADLATMIYDQIVDSLVNYKKKFLGLK